MSGKYLGSRASAFTQRYTESVKTYRFLSESPLKVSYRRLAPPSAQQCHLVVFHSLFRRTSEKGWFRIIRASLDFSSSFPRKKFTFHVVFVEFVDDIVSGVRGREISES